MKTMKRYPQYILFLDLLMLLLFVLISTPVVKHDIIYEVVGEQLPPDTFIFVVDNPNPVRHFDPNIQQWIGSRGLFNGNNTRFALCGNTRAECLRFLPNSIRVPEGQLLLGFSGETMLNIKNSFFETCSNPTLKNKCYKGLTLFIDEAGGVSLNAPVL